MKKLMAVACLSILSLAVAQAQDPAKLDPAHYKVILNNSNVRVLDIRVKPGEKTPMHSHPNYIIYSLTSSKVKFTMPNGKTNTATLKAGEATWRNAETHAGGKRRQDRSARFEYRAEKIVGLAAAICQSTDFHGRHWRPARVGVACMARSR